MSDPLIPCPNCGQEILDLGQAIDSDCVSFFGRITKLPKMRCVNCSAEVGETFAKVVHSYNDLIAAIFGESRRIIDVEYFYTFIEVTNELLGTLPATRGKLDWAQILRMRFGLTNGDSLTLREIGDKVGVTTQTVS